MMSRLVSIVLAVVLSALGMGASLSGCSHKVTGATPIASAALAADAVVIRINELQATVIDACGPAPMCRAGSLDTALARDIVQACIDIRTTLRAVPTGWQTTVKAGWQQARARFGSVTNVAILAALGLVDVAIGGL